MPSTPRPSHPSFDRHAAANGESDALDVAVEALMAIGAAALAEDAERGDDWAVFADWSWRSGRSALPASAESIEAWLHSEGSHMPTAQTVAVLDAIVAVHHDAGYGDPTGNS